MALSVFLNREPAFLAGFPSWRSSSQRRRLNSCPGDRLVPYADGLIEVFNRLNQMFGGRGLKDLVLRSAKLTLSEMQRAILDGVAAWRHGLLADDLTLVVVEVR